MRRMWTKEEEKLLIKWHGKCSKGELVAKFSDRSFESIKQKAHDLGLDNNVFRRGPWNPFFGKRHSEETKNKIREKNTPKFGVINVPNDQYKNLYGELRLNKGGVIVGNQYIKHICDSCNHENNILFKYFLNRLRPDLCYKCFIQTDEYKNMMSKAGKKYWSSLSPNERKEKLQHEITYEQRKRISMAHQKITDEANWPGFLSKQANKYNKEFKQKWEIWRDLIFKRDGYICQFPNCEYCNNQYGGIVLAPHHIIPKSDTPFLTFSIFNGITVCEEAHQKKINGHEYEFYQQFKKYVLGKSKLKLILFDLDGVLIDMCYKHFECLNKALKEISNYEIPSNEYEKWNGLSTNNKLQKLIIDGRIDISFKEKISILKQKYTIDEINKFDVDFTKTEIFRNLRVAGYTVGVVTNSIQQTTYLMLEKIGLLKMCDIIITNEDVVNIKPSSEPYIQAMISTGFFPNETLIVEDSEKGYISAKATGAKVYKVKDSFEVTWDNIQKYLEGGSN